jgi:hypothetical protein
MLLCLASLALRARSFRVFDTLYVSHDTRGSYGGGGLSRSSGWSLESDGGELRLMSNERIDGGTVALQHAPIRAIQWAKASSWTWGHRSQRALRGFLLLGSESENGGLMTIVDPSPIFRMELIWIAGISALLSVAMPLRAWSRSRKGAGFTPILPESQPGSGLVEAAHPGARA